MVTRVLLLSNVPEKLGCDRNNVAVRYAENSTLNAILSFLNIAAFSPATVRLPIPNMSPNSKYKLSTRDDRNIIGLARADLYIGFNKILNVSFFLAPTLKLTVNRVSPSSAKP